MPKSRKLVFVYWYSNQAVYLDGSLIYWGEKAWTSFALLNALGYECDSLPEIPTHNFPQEYDRDTKGWWNPPLSLELLKTQMTNAKTREAWERIHQLRKELSELESKYA